MTAPATELHANPFHLLDVTMRDDRQRIAARADERILELDPDACAKARSDLLNPRARLNAEVAWLPGVSPARARQFLERVLSDGRPAADETVPSLARANLLAAGLERAAGYSPMELAERLVEMATIVAEIDPTEVLRDINEDRTVARFPLVASEELIVQALSERGRYYRGVVREALNRMPAAQLVAAATQAVSIATDDGEEHPPAMIDELVDVYEVEAQPFLSAEAQNIEKLITAIRDSVQGGEAAVAPLIVQLSAVAKNWDMVAQPIQLGLRARGTEHPMSRQVAVSIRSLAVDLFNEHQMLDQARRLTDLLREVFAELPELSERLEEDAEALDSIEASRSASKSKRSEWAREIAYRAEIGMIMKDTLAISADGVSWRGKTYPLESITKVRWGGTRHSVNGIPTGTSFTIAFGDAKSEVVVETRREEVFNAFVERLWKAVGVRLLLETLQELKAGGERWVADVRIRDDGITLLRHKFWSKEPVHVPWNRIRVWSEGGALNIASTEEQKVNASLSYIHVANVHILDRMLRAALDRPGLRRLSELLT